MRRGRKSERFEGVDGEKMTRKKRERKLGGKSQREREE